MGKVIFLYNFSHSVFSYLLCAGFFLRTLLVLNRFKLHRKFMDKYIYYFKWTPEEESYLTQQNNLVSDVWSWQAGQTQSLSLWILSIGTFLIKGCICSPVTFSNAYGYFSCHNFELLLTWSGQKPETLLKLCSVQDYIPWKKVSVSKCL